MTYISPEITDSMEFEEPKSAEDHGLRPEANPNLRSSKTPETEREQFQMPHDTFTMLFISNDRSVTALAVYVFFFKIALYSLLLAEDLERETNNYQKGLVATAQALLLPVAVAMQQDLTNSLALLANTKYSKSLIAKLPGATYTSYIGSMILRLIDGIFSLTINLVVLLHSTSVLSMFLNFAALHFLQSIDDIVGEMCLRGFLGSRIQLTAKLAQDFTLPARRDDHWLRNVDSIGYCVILLFLIIVWIWFMLTPPEAASV